MDENVVLQDNKSATLSEKNSERSSGKRTRQLTFNFMMMDQTEKGNAKIMCCPMDDMAGNFMTKGPQGLKFGKFRKTIVGFQEKLIERCIFLRHGRTIAFVDTG